jgi:acyl-coenzyme A synthetase/AMP-(fatty) acid ligase
MKWGNEWRQVRSFVMRLLGTVGEPINQRRGVVPRDHRLQVSHHRHVVADGNWRRDDAPLPARSTPSRAAAFRFGVDAAVLDDKGKVKAGYLAIHKPWPGNVARCTAIRRWNTTVEVEGNLFSSDGAHRTRTATSGSWVAWMTW